jgi:hypothetical protein
MSDITTDRVTLLVDVLRSEHTDLEMPVQDWRHHNGSLVTDDEAAMIHATPIEDFFTAHYLLVSETDMLRQRAEDAARFRELVSPYMRSDDMPVDVLRLMPPAVRAEAGELWERIKPALDAWKNGA